MSKLAAMYRGFVDEKNGILSQLQTRIFALDYPPYPCRWEPTRRRLVFFDICIIFIFFLFFFPFVIGLLDFRALVSSVLVFAPLLVFFFYFFYFLQIGAWGWDYKDFACCAIGSPLVVTLFLLLLWFGGLCFLVRWFFASCFFALLLVALLLLFFGLLTWCHCLGAVVSGNLGRFSVESEMWEWGFIRGPGVFAGSNWMGYYIGWTYHLRLSMIGPGFWNQMFFLWVKYILPRVHVTAWFTKCSISAPKV